MILQGTIAAVSSAVGPAPRIIVRLSGGESFRILDAITSARDTRATAQRMPLGIAGMGVAAWVYSFAAPRSYTGEDLVELHLPGNPLLARITLDELARHGARPAEPGEFTARAFFNARMDLSQAEGVAAVVAAGNQAELEAGRKLMAGELSRRLRPAMDDLAHTLAMIEAEIDFSDQDAQFVSAKELRERIVDITGRLLAILGHSSRLGRVGHEPRIVLAGRPNAGKSSLLNALAETQRAVVSPVAGTTRDALSASVVLRRGIVRLVDVAGLEEVSANDPIAAAMRTRALSEIDQADAVVLVRETGDDRPELDLDRNPDLTIITKIDLAPAPKPPSGVSVITGDGIPWLKENLDALIFGRTTTTARDAELALTGRHVQAISAAQVALSRILAPHPPPMEIIAAELRQALDSLGQVLGTVWPDDILGKIFATFCMGK